MEQVAIIGGNTLIGQHLIKALSNLPSLKLINVWNLSEKFFFRLPDNNNFDNSCISSFCGLAHLEAAVYDCDTVFNLHEFQDFSLIPDKQGLKEHNVNFVRKLLDACKQARVGRFVQLSSIYLQCSRWWPNVGGREADFKNFEKEIPFKAYCKSKNEAEQMCMSYDEIQKIIVRVGPVYGEGDRSSLICDSIYWSKFSNILPLFGDQGGALQMTYAGNVAEAFIQFANKMIEDRTIDNEIVLVQDNTPVKDIYELALKPCYTTNTRRVSNISIPFYLLFFIYMLISALGSVMNKVIGYTARFEQLPSPSYLYFVFRHWTFLSGFKQRVYFDYVPKFSYEESIERSQQYYKQVTFEDVNTFSWSSYPQ